MRVCVIDCCSCSIQLGLTCSNQAGITNLDNLDNINTNFDNLDVVITDDFVIDIISHVSHTSKLVIQVSRISAISLDSLDDFARLANTSRANANHIHPLRGVYTTNSASFDTTNTGYIELDRAGIGHEGHNEHENHNEFDGDYGHIEPNFTIDDYD